MSQVSDEASTGLVYLNTRYYDPVVAIFVSPDPLMNPKDPKTLDPYRYAENNPVTYTDPTGLIVYCGKGNPLNLCIANDDNDASTLNVTTKAPGTTNSSGGSTKGTAPGLVDS